MRPLIELVDVQVATFERQEFWPHSVTLAQLM